MLLHPTDPATLTYEPDDTFVVYVNHWVTIVSQLAGVDAGMDRADSAARVAEAVSLCQQFFADGYRGRIREEDMRCEVSALGDDVVVRLSLRLPIIVGEFVSPHLAQTQLDSALSADADGPAEIVVRGSLRQKQIDSYGKIMLPVG